MPINTSRYEALAGEVLKVYEEAELTMMRRVANRLQRGITQPGWTERKYGEMRDVTREMTTFMGKISANRAAMQQKFITDAYNAAQVAAISDAELFVRQAGIQFLTANTVKVASMLSELDSTMRAADRHILRQVNDDYASVVGRVSALVATGSITYREAVQRELVQWASRGITSFVDKAGRSWDMETYAEMATLTAIERATREGYMDAMREFDYDLCQISDHYGACPICEAWQGVVISISGKTPGYPTLWEAENAGVFHPRCMHDMSVYREGISTGARDHPAPVMEASPGYAVRSKQRYFERQERMWKRQMAVAATPQAERAAYARVRMYQDRIRELVDDYNAVTEPSVDHIPRKYEREGGRAKLSAAARKLKPVQVPSGQQAAHFVPVSTLGETKEFARTAGKSAASTIANNSISLKGRSQEEIVAFYRSAERSGGLWASRDSAGNITKVHMDRKTFNAMDKLVDTLADRARVHDVQMERDYAAIRKMVSDPKKPLYFSKYDRNSIADYNRYAWSSANFVKTTLDERATSIDTIYGQLVEQFPSYFSGDANNPADRLLEINEVMAGMKESRSVAVAEYYGPEGLKAAKDEIYRDVLRGYFETRDTITRGR